jgi:hypothetical protein
MGLKDCIEGSWTKGKQVRGADRNVATSLHESLKRSLSDLEVVCNDDEYDESDSQREYDACHLIAQLVSSQVLQNKQFHA